ncbi:MAG: hypothetical protein NWR72_09480, partial [Bacteroidia bacterium]|nr:hypothetical protein [Bacteroidia bacterium]
MRQFAISLFNVLFLSMLLVSCKEPEVKFVKGTDPEPDPIATGMTAAKVTTEMGPGFNLGNTFENGNNPTTLAAAKPILDAYFAAG